MILMKANRFQDLSRVYFLDLPVLASYKQPWLNEGLKPIIPRMRGDISNFQATSPIYMVLVNWHSWFEII
jgi:hypothetical protein